MKIKYNDQIIRTAAYKVGSNQYKKRHKKSTLELTWKQTIGASILSSIILLGILNAAFPTRILADSKIVSPIADATNFMGVASPSAQLEEVSTSSAVLIDTPTPTTQYQDIKKDIFQVFGKDADKAMLLLSCENKGLNPTAINDNTKWGGVGQDIGIFQINNHWQGVSNKAFLEDPAINIRMAYNIYSRDGHSFKLWTCGRKFGI